MSGIPAPARPATGPGRRPSGLLWGRCMAPNPLTTFPPPNIQHGGWVEMPPPMIFLLAHTHSPLFIPPTFGVQRCWRIHNPPFTPPPFPSPSLRWAPSGVRGSRRRGSPLVAVRWGGGVTAPGTLSMHPVWGSHLPFVSRVSFSLPGGALLKSLPLLPPPPHSSIWSFPPFSRTNGPHLPRLPPPLALLPT